MLKNRTFPGQVPYNCILPKDLDNLIVPVCLSASHIGWGTIRLEPTWMSIGESAAYAVSMAVNQKIAPSAIRKDKLMRLLARKGVMLSFYSDVEGREYARWYPAVQYLGTKGFFGTYEANATERLSSALADMWLPHAGRLITNPLLDAGKYATEIFASDAVTDAGISAGKFAKKLSETEGFSKQKVLALLPRLNLKPDALITRGDACRIIFEATEQG